MILSQEDALDYLIDAAFIAGTMWSESKFDHYDASDYLQWAAERYGEAVTGVEVGS